MIKKLMVIFFLGIFLIGIVSAIETSYCCEKTSNGAWCQNAPEGDCNSAFRKAPTSCESTSYCKLGCCYDSQEGTCMENTPEKVCEVNGGVWEESADCSIPQCSLGCCLIGNQASFVTQTRCKQLSSLYGLEINFRTDLGNELECLASAMSDAKGACVFEKEYATTCIFTTKKECAELTGNGTSKFHEGYLCSAESLATICGPTEKTTCIEGRDEVYFVDSCGNPANIYDASKIDDKEYWSKIYGKAESCNYGNSNANSRTCGNCDYYLGSICKKAEISQSPVKGDYICADLSCEYEGKEYQHGESWCADSKGLDKNLPGSRAFRLLCYNGEVTVEPCADFRQEICIEDSVGDFSYAACRVNKWQDCAAQSDNTDVKEAKKNCENEEKRDCIWLGSTKTCVPKYAPGFNFWDTSGNSSEGQSFCSLATATCVVKYEKDLFGHKKCVENCHCLEESWKNQMKDMCIALGDCGVKTNYMGVKGFND